MSASANHKKIFVGNLDFGVTDTELATLFELQIGPVEGVNIRKDKATNRPRGFAFVTFQDPNDAQKAIDTMQNFVHKGRTLSIKPQIARGSKTGNSQGKKGGKKQSIFGSKKTGGWFMPQPESSPTLTGAVESNSASPSQKDSSSSSAGP